MLKCSYAVRGRVPPSRALRFLCYLLFILFAFMRPAVFAQAPQWWQTRGVLAAMPVTNDYAPANIGQLKHIALQAYYEMQTNLPGGAGADASNLVFGFTPGGDYYPVNLGQLKNTALPFHDRLIATGYATNYPWPSTPTNDYLPVNIGQMKYVFAFDFADSDADGMADWWENLQGFDPANPSDANQDADIDGLANSAEYQNGCDPHNPDTDGDGATDGAEVVMETNPLINPGDTDQDTLSDDLEVVLGTNPESADSDLDWASDGYEYQHDTDPLDAASTPVLALLINNNERYTLSTNVTLQFPGVVALRVLVGKTTNLSDGAFLSFSSNMAYGIQQPTNGPCTLYGRLYRDFQTYSSNITGEIIFDDIPPVIASTQPTNGYVTNRRWIKMTAQATDSVSQVRVFVNGEWAHGANTNSFWRDRYPLVRGTNAVAITAMDMAGNIVTQSLQIIQDTTGDNTAPQISTILPGQTIITNQGQVLCRAVYGNNEQLYFRGDTDDETAEVLSWVTSGDVTNGPWAATVAGTQFWGNVHLESGTNLLRITAVDAAGNRATNLCQVVRNTGFVFKITNPVPYQVMNAASAIVAGVASPQFLNATITVNGVSTILENRGGSVGFRTTTGVLLSEGRTELIGRATLNGCDYYTDPPPVGYEIRQYQEEMIDRWFFDVQYDDGYRVLHNSVFHSLQQWYSRNGLLQWNTYYSDYFHCEYDYYGTICYDLPSPGYSSAYQEYPEFKACYGYAQYRGQWNEWYYLYDCDTGTRQWKDSELRFIKRWPTQEMQVVILQFPDMRIGKPAGFPWDFGYDAPVEDPSLITYRGQTGFWYNGNVSFIVPIMTEVEYTIRESDFTWPTFESPICCEFTGYESGKKLSFNPMISNDLIKVDLKEVSFSGTKYHIVKKDDGTQDYPAPHWQDNSSPLDGDADDAGDKKYPVCFTRNTKMKVTAKWRIEPANPGVSIKVKGDGSGNLDFPETTAAVSGNDLTITDVECSNPFVNEVDFFDPMSITWSFSMDGGSTWYNAGTSVNQTYVTLGDPQATIYHTVVHIGCKNAEGENDPGQTITKAWGEFTSLVVKRASDGHTLIYYKTPYDPACPFDVAGLLSGGDGRCGAWARLFRDVIKAQGIAGAEWKQIVITPQSGLTPHALWVKNQDLTPLSATPPSPPVPLPGVNGQGTADPSASVFVDHAVVTYGTTIYDSSYGTCFTGLGDWQKASLDAISYYNGGAVFTVNSGAGWPLLVQFGIVEP